MTKEAIELLNGQLESDEKELKELKIKMLSKRLAIRAMKKVAKKSEITRPNRRLNKAIACCTNFFVKMNKGAIFAIEDPDGTAAKTLYNDACVLSDKATKIPDKTHKKANKICLQCSNMVCRVESALEQLDLCKTVAERLSEMAVELDSQVQRLRPTPPVTFSDQGE